MSFAIVINEKGGQPRRQEFLKGEITIGRVQGNDIVLPKQNVSKRHSRIVLKMVNLLSLILSLPMELM